MKAILKAIRGIASFFSTIIDAVIGLFEDIAYIVKLTAKALASIPDYFGWLPTSIVSILVVLIGIVVVYKVLGREG